MGAYNVVSRAAMAAGQPEDITVVLANLDAIAAVLNGGIDNSNINAAAAIAASKLAGYPADVTKTLLGDGTWGSAGADGWTGTVALTFSSADSPTYVCTTASDLTGVIGVGDRIKLTHAAATKYFIVTAIAAGTITLYGGTDYTLAAGAITNPYYSHHKAPLGFPLNPAKWTVETSNATQYSQVPDGTTVYNMGSIVLNLPIGAWHVNYKCGTQTSSANSYWVALSTSSSSISDADLRDTAPVSNVIGSLSRNKTIVVAAKTPYYLVETTTSAAGFIYLLGSDTKTILRAVCAYL